MKPPLSPIASALRAQLLTSVDLAEVSRIANQVENQVVEMLNGMNINVAVHLVAQALIARASIGVAATWWSEDISKQPLPETSAALWSIATDPPASLIDHIIDTRKEGHA